MELYQKTAAELSAMLKNKEVSSVELTKAAFARTAAVEDKVGAYITLTRSTHWRRQQRLTPSAPQARSWLRWQVCRCP